MLILVVVPEKRQGISRRRLGVTRRNGISREISKKHIGKPLVDQGVPVNGSPVGTSDRYPQMGCTVIKERGAMKGEQIEVSTTVIDVSVLGSNPSLPKV